MLLHSAIMVNRFVQQLCHEKAYNEYSINTITYEKISSLELNTVILSEVMVNKTSIAYWYDIYFIASWSVIDSLPLFTDSAYR